MEPVKDFIFPARTCAVKNNIKRVMILFFMILFAQPMLFKNNLLAQDLPLSWAKKMGGIDPSNSNDIKVDGSGNIYTTGGFAGTADFDPGPGTYSLSSPLGTSIYVSKQDAAGNLIWAREMFAGNGTAWGYTLTIDANGNIIIAGMFNGTVNFNPASSYQLTSQASFDYFICKLDPNGNFIWAKQIGNSMDELFVYISSDINSNIYITGYVNGTVDLDPGAGIYNISTTGNHQEAYVVKLDAAGNFTWAKQFTGGGNSSPSAIFVTDNGDSYIFGYFGTSQGNSTIDFDPGPGVYNLTSLFQTESMFICKLDGNGNFVWARQLAAVTTFANSGTLGSITVGSTGDIYVTGGFKGTFDFDPGPGTFNMSSNTPNETFILKLDAAGNFIWAKYIATAHTFPSGGYQVMPKPIFTDATGNVYVYSSFVNTVDFDPGPGIYNLTSFGKWDIFLLKLDNAGNFISVKQQGGIGDDACIAATTTANGEIVATGTFNAVSDFDPCPGTYNLTPQGGNPVIFVLKLAFPAVTISAPSTSICSGTPITFTASVSNPANNPSYQWQVNGINAGTNSNTFTSSTLNDNDQVKLVLTTNASCSPPIIVTSNIITVTVSSSFVPSVSISTTANTICAGSAAGFTAVPTNGGTTPSWQWQVNGINAGTNSATFSSNTLVNGDVVKVIMTSGINCALPAIATSNTIAMTVNPVITASVNITANATTICAGAAATFTAVPVNGGTTPSYQWQVNGIPVGTNTAVYSTSALVNGDVVNVIMTSNAACVAAATVTSNNITITVNPVLAASVNITASATTICAGTAANFTASPVNGGSTPSYQWQVNGIPVGTNTAVYSNAALANGDAVNVIMTSNAGCVMPAIATSNAITMTVASSVPASVNISSTANTVCAGSTVTFTATAINGGTMPVYQWQVNGINVGSNSATYTTNTLANTDVVKVIMTSDLSCAAGSPAVSNAIMITVDPLITPAVNILASATVLCPGSLVSFTATPVNGGSAPVYQWQVNGINVGINNSVYTTNSLLNADQVKCILTSNHTCVTNSAAISNTVQVIVNTAVIPAVNIIASANNICSGTLITFTATAVNGGSTPLYQWKINGINVGTNSAIYATNAIANNDIITCTVTNSNSCSAVTTATSNSIQMMVSTVILPSLHLTASSNNVCPGTAVSFTALPANTGTAPSYQWKLNGINVGDNSPAYITNMPANGDKINCIMNTITSCSADPAVFSDTLVMLVKPVPYISFNPPAATISPGGSVQLNATIIGTYTSYLWTPSTGLNDAAILNPMANPSTSIVYKLKVVSPGNCISEKTMPVTVNKDIYIPNSFTPDGNGINDIFRIPPGTPLNLQSFRIYDRYGNLVFNTVDINEGWDGTYKGTSSPAGAYTYLIKGSGPKGEIFLRGSVIVIR